MKQFIQLQNIFILLLSIMIVNESCIYEPDLHSVAIIENKTDSIVYITTPIDIIYNNSTSKVIFNPYEPEEMDVVNIDTIGLKGTFKMHPLSSVAIIDQPMSPLFFNIDFLSIKSPKQKITLTSSNEIAKAFTSSGKDTCVLTINK